MAKKRVTKIHQAKKLLNELNKLDAHYLVGYPTNMSRKEYLAKRNKLRNKFEALKK